MAAILTGSARRDPIQSALRVLKEFSLAGQVAFDQLLAQRILSEAERAIPGDDAAAWVRRLVETGESLNLRIRGLECTLDEALSLVGQGTPVAYCVGRPDGGIEWNVATAARGRKVRLAPIAPDDPERWLSRRKLARQLHLPSANSPAHWVIGQPALGCQAAGPASSGHLAAEGKLTPLGRLFGFLRPEKKDLWIVLVFSFVVGVLALATPVAVEALVNTVAFGRYLQPVVVLALLLFTFLAFAAATRALITFVVEVLQRRMFIRIVEDLAYRLPRVKQEELDQHHGPELTNRFFEVVTLQKSVASILIDGISIVLQTLIGMVVLAFYHPFLLGFDVALLVLIGVVVFGLGRGAVSSAIKESKTKYIMAAWLQELTRHPTAFKLHSGPQFALHRADHLAVDWLDARRHHFRIVIRQIVFALGMQAVATTALLGLGGWLVIQGELTLGQLVAAELIVMMIVGSFAKLGKHLQSFYQLLAAMDKLAVLFDLSIEPHDKLFHLRDGDPATISVNSVGYKYSGRSVLKDVCLELQPGQVTALVGPSGCGKSTLMELLCGSRTPNSGHIELDGIDLRELRPDSLREHLALSRSIEIFHGSIDENVHLNRPSISASDVRDALSTVGLLDELQLLPDGLSTMLAINGAPLSSSQAQRLMLARAICGRPRLLLIDGTLDSLPDADASEVLAKLASQRSSWTILVATARQAVIDGCDRQAGLGKARNETTDRISTS